MALIQDNKTKLFLSKPKRRLRRFQKEPLPRGAGRPLRPILREKGFDVTAVLDTGGSCEPTQADTSVNETINYVDQFGRPARLAY